MKIIKNAVANVFSGLSAALLAVVLPPFLIEYLTDLEFGIWVLMLQVGAYIGFLNFGFQTAVARFVAQLSVKNDFEKRDSIVSISFYALLGLGVIGLVIIVMTTVYLQTLFSQIPVALVNDAKILLLSVGLSYALALPFSVYSGIFLGLQRNFIPAFVNIGNKLLTAIALIIAAKNSMGLIEMGWLFLLINVMTCLLLWWLKRRLACDIRIGFSLIRRIDIRELFVFSGALAVWSIAMLLVSGIDVTLVGVLDFNMVGYFGVAVSLITLYVGLQQAIFSTLIPVASKKMVLYTADEMGSYLIKVTKYSSFFLFTSGIWMLIGAHYIFYFWLNQEYAELSTEIFQILLVANIVRLTANPYGMLVVATAQQKKVLLTPFLEAFVNLIISVVLGMLYGAIGVAVGTIIGAFVGVLSNYYYNMPRTMSIKFSLNDYLKNSILLPLLLTLPLLLLFFVNEMVTLGLLIVSIISTVSVVFILWMGWCFLLEREDKSVIQKSFRGVIYAIK